MRGRQYRLPLIAATPDLISIDSEQNLYLFFYKFTFLYLTC